MAHSAQAKLKSPQAVLQLGVSNEDSKVKRVIPLKRCILFTKVLYLIVSRVFAPWIENLNIIPLKVNKDSQNDR